MLIIANCKLDWGRRIDKLIYLECISYCIKLGLCLSLNNKFLGNLGWFFCPESYHTLSQPQRPKWALFSTPTLNTLTRNWFFFYSFFKNGAISGWSLQEENQCLHSSSPSPSHHYHPLLTTMACDHLWPTNSQWILLGFHLCSSLLHLLS